MSRNPQGQYSLPAGYFVNIGDTVLPSQHNPPLQDIQDALTGSLSRDGYGGMRANLAMGANRITGLAPGVNATDAATVGQIQGDTPIGFLGEWPTAIAPAGWLICAGQSVSRTTYAQLFAVLGTTFGSASSATFNLPDYRGRAGIGLDVDAGSGFANRITGFDNKVIGQAGGAQSHTLAEAEIPAHNHGGGGNTSTTGSHYHNTSGTSASSNGLADVRAGVFGGGNLQQSPSDFRVTAYAGNHSHTYTVTSFGGGEAHNNVQPSIVINKIIKAL